VKYLAAATFYLSGLLQSCPVPCLLFLLLRASKKHLYPSLFFKSLSSLVKYYSLFVLPPMRGGGKQHRIIVLLSNFKSNYRVVSDFFDLPRTRHESQCVSCPVGVFSSMCGSCKWYRRQHIKKHIAAGRKCCPLPKQLNNSLQ
jgi:hypothetical protein